ncbi:DNA repair protein RecN [Pseudobdellovibrio exovorus]|uniref:DNA repair protein RecN n=1 Tax=Pseudobdellovibrio exovorus JSS TaxID=1184267 RepID=M4VSN0_9BACT|nr:DNA repair protein RecN [Pseudobdellovibrio exovorus]AGH96219.1 DNA repair protein [Pseudobdellovibrio exovorus JSS]
MLQELKVSQFAIIDNLHIEFQAGLNILSGETGSGKSVLLKSLALLMGEKASSDIIRSGAQQAVVEGAFDLRHRHDIQSALNQFGIETPDNTLIVKRIIATSDRSKIYLNGSICTLSQLREIVSPMIELTGHNAPLIEMTGQHDNRNLLSKAYHLDLLDQYAGHYDKRTAFEQKFAQLNTLKTQISDFEKQAQEKSQRLDFLKFQLTELEKLNIDPIKDASLEDEIRSMKSSHKVLRFVDECEDILFGDHDSVVSRLKTIEKKSNEISSVSPEIDERVSALEQARVQIEDTFYLLRKDLNKIQLDPEVLEEKESRLSQIRKLQKKYGPDLNEIAEAFTKMKTEVYELENSDAHLDKIRKQASLLELELKQLAEDLHKTRNKVAGQLEKAVNTELLDLNMKGVSFFIQVQKSEQLTSTGISDIEYLCQTSSKDPKRPISKVASGGELSRILLALKKSLGQSETPRTYLFDEVDTGVSGNTAEKVGKKLKSIAKGQQVICVTHLPQVAACGDVHFSISKSATPESVNMMVEELKSKARIEEIARLISGEKITKTSLAHAEQLLSESH